MGATHIVARAIAAVVVAAGLAAVPQAAQALPPAPGGLGSSVANPPVLSWDRVTGAEDYDVQVDDDPTFDDPTFEVTTVNTRAVPTTVLGAGDQFWRVRAHDDTGLAGPWADASFVVDPVPAPSNLTPDGTTLQQPGSPPLLSWDEVRGAEKYVVQLDDAEDTEYVGAHEYTTTVTSLVVPEALPTGDNGESYRWRVKAVRDGKAGVESAYSSDAVFTLKPLDTVTLVSPADGAVVQDVELDWQPLPGAAYYELQVSTDDSFSASTVIDDRTGRNRVLGTRYSPPVTYDNNTYYWRVRAVDTSGNPSAWSRAGDPPSFVRSWAGVANTPVQTAPANNANVGPGWHLQWTPVRNASMYEVQMGPDPNFSPGTFNVCQVAGTTYAPGSFVINDVKGLASTKSDDKCTPNAGIRTYWRVRPLDLPFSRSGTATRGVQGIFSAIRSFTFGSTPVGGGSIGMTPSGGATVDVPVLSWQAVQGASSYKISVWDRTGSSVVSKDRTYATSYVPAPSTPLTAAKSPYEWSLTAYDEAGDAVTLEMHTTFSVSDAAPSTGPWSGDAAPLTPLTADDTATPTRRAPLMAWAPMPGASYYRVFAGPSGSGALFPSTTSDVFGSDNKIRHPAVTDTYTWLLDAGDYDWYVVAYDASNVAIATGPTATFRIADLGAVRDIRLALDGNAFGADGLGGFAAPLSCTEATCTDATSTPVISWQPVEDAGYYMIYLSEDPDFTNVVEPLTSLPATMNTRWAPTMSQVKGALAESLAGGSYYLHVRPCKAGSHCGPRPVSTSGMATNKFRKKSPAVKLEQPAAGATVASTEVTFDWQDYRDTNAATPWSQTGEAGTQSAQWYRIQVDDDENFSSPIDTLRVDQSTYTAFNTAYPDGPLYWRVQAIDADDNDLTWSDKRAFTKTTPVVALTSPAQDEVRHGTTVFRWQPRPSAAHYDVELYRNNDTTFSSGNRVFHESTGQTAFVWDESIPASATPYLWRVRTVDADGNAGPWSVPRRFVSSTEVPTVEGPADGAYLQGDDILLKWTSVLGATAYKVELMSPTGSLSERVTTKATAYAPSRTLADGTWQWKVSALTASGDAIGSTGWATFVLDETGPDLLKVAPTTVRAKSTLTLSFSERVKNVSSRTVYLTKLGSRKKIAARVTLSSDQQKVKLNPKGRLRPSTTYTLHVTGRLTDLRGNRSDPTTKSIFVR
ncbi:Ig-like domain-containing protein [Nocardioides sp. MH1]|uniref:Ig-like domain-containing protein n=1 Tax=Nocardioides sp. MH1 TaxID=3242490 RepID=UPI003520CBB8